MKCMMIDAVFISDLHLSPHEPEITARFYHFIQWAAAHTRAVYILGDFFHVWPGDEALDAWSGAIADQIAWLTGQGICVYFMPGNRDFLIGKAFLERAHLILLSDPALITLGQDEVLLAHGDAYCTRDKGHQWLRRFTRNRWFAPVFLSIPYAWRANVVSRVRQRSQSHRQKPSSIMDVTPNAVLKAMQKHNTHVLIHGHTHKPGLTTHIENNVSYRQYVLSDWDDNPQILCYDKSSGFYFNRLEGVSHG